MQQTDPKFEIRNRRWQRIFMYVTLALGLTGVMVTTPLVCMDLVPGINTWALPLIFLMFAVAGGFGTYVAAWEKFFLKDGVFVYQKPFKRTCKARAGELSAVRAMNINARIIKVEFLGQNGETIFSVLDDGMMFRDGKFAAALEALEIPGKGLLQKRFL